MSEIQPRVIPPGPDEYEDEEIGQPYDPNMELLIPGYGRREGSDLNILISDYIDNQGPRERLILQHWVDQLLGVTEKTDLEFARETGISANKVINTKRKARRELRAICQARMEDCRRLGISPP